jgi:phosphoribosylformimino-5-aminoimidazole carboxamide ribotide isomerase
LRFKGNARVLLIPSIDLRGGHNVRLLKGDFDAETRYELPPHQQLAHYQRLGARWVHVVDLDGARDGLLANRDIIRELAAQRGVQLQVGGGLRELGAIEDLLDRGVARVVIGSAAVEQRDEVIAWMRRLGPERVCLAFDVRLDGNAVPRLRIHGWRQQSVLALWDAVEGFADHGLRHVLCTDIERDGALTGPNLALYSEALRRFPQIQWQASGGISSGADLAALAAYGVPSAISGKALLEQRISPEELRPFLPNA